MKTASLGIIAGLLAGIPAALAARGTTTPARHTRRHASSPLFVAVLDGAYEMPSDLSHATATAELFTEGRTLHYQVHSDSIADVTRIGIHIGSARENEPAVAYLFQGDRAGVTNGLLVAGTLEAQDLHGATMRELVRDLRDNDVYITIATQSHPAGEVRGQFRAQHGTVR
jgi:hypothetical protein